MGIEIVPVEGLLEVLCLVGDLTEKSHERFRVPTHDIVAPGFRHGRLLENLQREHELVHARVGVLKGRLELGKLVERQLPEYRRRGDAGRRQQESLVPLLRDRERVGHVAGILQTVEGRRDGRVEGVEREVEIPRHLGIGPVAPVEVEGVEAELVGDPADVQVEQVPQLLPVCLQRMKVDIQLDDGVGGEGGEQAARLENRVGADVHDAAVARGHEMGGVQTKGGGVWEGAQDPRRDGDSHDEKLHRHESREGALGEQHGRWGLGRPLMRRGQRWVGFYSRHCVLFLDDAKRHHLTRHRIPPAVCPD